MNYVCTDCQQLKPVDAFYKDLRNTIKGVRHNCKECYRKAVSAYKAVRGHTASDKARSKRWRENNLEKCREQERARRERNIDSYRAALRKYEKANPHVYAKYRALKKSRMPAWADQQQIKVVYRKAKEYGFQVDHIVPLTSDIVCGLHVWDNLQLLDKSANSAKSNRVWPDMPDVLTASQIVAAQA